MQEINTFKIFELHKVNSSLEFYKTALMEIENKIKQTKLQEEEKKLINEKEKVQKKIVNLEAEKENLNEELVNSEAISELIKIKYALLLSNYAAYHENPVGHPKKEVRTLIQKILSFKK